jgi:hypothetical protein
MEIRNAPPPAHLSRVRSRPDDEDLKRVAVVLFDAEQLEFEEIDHRLLGRVDDLLGGWRAGSRFGRGREVESGPA